VLFDIGLLVNAQKEGEKWTFVANVVQDTLMD